MDPAASQTPGSPPCTEVKIAFIISRKVVLFGTLKVQPIILIDVGD